MVRGIGLVNELMAAKRDAVSFLGPRGDPKNRDHSTHHHQIGQRPK